MRGITMKCAAAAILALLPGAAAAQTLQPGYVDPWPVLEAAEAAIGAGNLRCVTVSGDAYAGMVGQQRLAGYDTDWPRGEPLTRYTRTMDWTARTMTERFEREPGHNPAGWKHGLGWRGGTPLQRQREQTFVVAGQHAWTRDGAGGDPVAAAPADAELWQLDLWLNPHGFLKAARLPGANPRAVWRWELGEMGRDGATTIPEKMTIVSITMFGKFRVDATINREHLLQRIHTWVPDPVFGDTNYEHEFTNDSYVDIGGGVRFPTRWHSHTGWDDNYQAQSFSAGRNGFGGTLADIRPNACGDPLEAPEAVRRAGLRGARRTAAACRWRVAAGRRLAQQRGGRVRGIRRRRGGAARRGAQLGGDRGDSPAGPGQADSATWSTRTSTTTTSAGCAPTCTSAPPSSRIGRTTTSTGATC